jgi:DNA-directed RNA polymerase specialized sigma24 family protein
LEIPQEEIAREEGVAKDVISSRLYRAKQWIRQNFQDQYDEAMGRKKEPARH